jgi:CO/xanthine dehydrogenase FAD-binding subunit
MRAFDYASPGALDDVLALLPADGDESIRPLAGGTDLLTLMKADIVAPAQLVNIKGLPELSRIRDEGSNGLTLGALTTLAELETSPDNHGAVSGAGGGGVTGGDATTAQHGDGGRQPAPALALLVLP